MYLIKVVGRQEAMALPPPVEVKLMNDGDQGRTEEQKNGKDDVAVDIRRRIVERHLAHSEGDVAGVHIERVTPILVTPGMELMTVVPVGDKTVDKGALVVVDAGAETSDTMSQDRNTMRRQGVIGGARLQIVDQEEAGESQLRRYGQNGKAVKQVNGSDPHGWFIPAPAALATITQPPPSSRSDHSECTVEGVDQGPIA
jgi:hypothetical protein